MVQKSFPQQFQSSLHFAMRWI